MANNVVSLISSSQAAGNWNLAKTVAEGIFQLFPGASLLVGTVANFRLQFQLARLQNFIDTAQLDENYLNQIANDAETMELFLECVEQVIHTPSSLACAAIALIYRDHHLGPSLKSLYAHSLSGISIGTLNVFMQTMEYVENPDHPYIDRFGKPLTNTSAFLMNLDLLDFGKELIEKQGFISDLVTRNICPQVSISTLQSESHGNNLTISPTSRRIYTYLKEAKRITNS